MLRRFALPLLTATLCFASFQPVDAQDDTSAIGLLVQTLNQVDSPDVQASLLEGMLSGLDGQRNVQPPKAWPALAARLAKSPNAKVRDLTNRLAQIFGDEKATETALALIRNRKANLDARRRALHALLTQKNQQVSQLLEPLLDEPEMRMEAIRGFAAIENAEAPSILLKRYATWSESYRKAILETLATRKPYAKAVLEAIRAGRLDKADIPAHVARSMSFLAEDAFTEVFGKVRDVSQDRKKQIAKYKKIITAEAIENANAGRGRVVFKKTCGACHLMYGEGGKIGPDLTGSNRANLDYLLLNSVDPSYDVPKGYKMITIHTADGRVVNGVIAEENEQRIILKTVEQPRLIVLKDDIEARRVSEKSMMPDGQLEKMKPQEMFDLIKYMQTFEQVDEVK